MVELITDPDLLRDIVWHDSHDYTVIQSNLVSKSRWHDVMETVFKRESDGKLFITDWRRGATENQDHEMPELAIEAEEFTQTIVSYRAVTPKRPKGPSGWPVTG